MAWQKLQMGTCLGSGGNPKLHGSEHDRLAKQSMSAIPLAVFLQ